MNRLLRKIWQFLFRKQKFASFGKNSVIHKTVKTSSTENIRIGEGVTVGMHTWIEAKPLTGEKVACLILHDGATVGEYNHIYSTHCIEIEKNVLTANFVYISDNLHSYEDITLPILKNPIKQLQPVVIGEGSWLGEHVAVIGASIGKHSVIGANSVVTKDIPDYCVAVGSPAFVVKRYDFKSGIWKRTSKDGLFIEE